MQAQHGERQRRVVPSVMVGMRQCGAIGIELKGQRLVVMMSLARVVHQAVLDLKCQVAHLSRHEGQRRLQLQHDQDKGEPTTEHGAILAKTLLALDCLEVFDLQFGQSTRLLPEATLVVCSWPARAIGVWQLQGSLAFASTGCQDMGLLSSVLAGTCSSFE